MKAPCQTDSLRSSETRKLRPTMLQKTRTASTAPRLSHSDPTPSLPRSSVCSRVLGFASLHSLYYWLGRLTIVSSLRQASRGRQSGQTLPTSSLRGVHQPLAPIVAALVLNPVATRLTPTRPASGLGHYGHRFALPSFPSGLSLAPHSVLSGDASSFAGATGD